MPIFVRYKKSIYKINIKDGIFIIRNQVWLFTRRVLRLLKRILLRSSDIFIILLCVTAFSTLIVPMGIFIEKYNNWYDVFWDMRTFFLTSIIIAFVLTNLNEEKSRRINLYKQFYMYSAYMFDLEYYIRDLVYLLGISSNDNIYLTEKDYDNFSRKLEEQNVTKEFFYIDIDNFKHNNPNSYIVYIHRKHLANLRDILHFINSSDGLEMHKNQARKWILDSISTIEYEVYLIENIGEEYTAEHLKTYLKDALSTNLYIIAELRRPWRWDHERNMQVRKILSKKGTHMKGMHDSNEYWL